MRPKCRCNTRMRCLFCGKELALLKRLRGGGEFCSEAHRKEYQEQYEQLALARLLQAKPADAPGQSPLSPISVPENPPRQSTPSPAESHIPARPAASAVAMIEATSSPKSAPPALAEADPAPLAGFVEGSLVPAINPLQHAGTLDLHPVTTPALPEAAADSGVGNSIPPAEPLELEVSIQALDQHIRASERSVELREFAGPAPVIELHLQSATGTEPTGEAETMEVSMTPHPPQKASPWLGPARSFAPAPVQLGELARLDFAAIDFAHTDIRLIQNQATKIDSPSAVLDPIVPALETAEQAQPESIQASTAASHEPTVEPAAEPELAPPALVTKALPVTLHGLAAPRGKFVQPFGAIAPASDVQIPASTSLPLRPMIVFGPAPVAAAPVPDAPKPAAPAQEKPVASPKPPVTPQPQSSPAKLQPAPAAEIGAKAENKSQAKQEPVKAETPTAPPPAKPLVKEAASQISSDRGIPSLRLEATESAWSKLSAGLKIGIAAGVVAAIAGIGYVVTRGGNKPAVETPVAVSSPPSAVAGVPISGGWIDDWANAAKTKRHVSLLSGSAKLSDYRVEFQAQIESKAIGWVFRGLNPRNYYVAKLETITPGLEPTVALVHFAVVDGQDEARVVVPLPMKSRVDTTYKIRFDAVGNRFTVWVQGQQVAEWSDTRFGSGGVGFFSDHDEKAAMQGPVNVVALVPKN